MRHLILLLFVLAGCESTSPFDDVPDATGADGSSDTGRGMDAALDAGTDVTRPDVTDAARDAPPADASDVSAVDVSDGSSADATACGEGVACHAYWCGCGRCDPSAITCITGTRECPLDCASACPEIDTTVCRCEGGACRRDTDAGATDAGTAGDGSEGSECTTSEECGRGLLCCYPCGIPGCHNRCISPDPGTGRCPLFP